MYVAPKISKESQQQGLCHSCSVSVSVRNVPLHLAMRGGAAVITDYIQQSEHHHENMTRTEKNY